MTHIFRNSVILNFTKLQCCRLLNVKNQNNEFSYDSSKPQLSFLGFLGTLARQRELLAHLVTVDLMSRYRRSFLGLLWTLINPVISSLVLWLVFVSVFKSRLSSGTQFAPYLLAGVLTVTFFNQGLMQSAESISMGTRLFLKIRIDPRLFAISNSVSNAVNFFIGILALALVSYISSAPISIKFPLVLFVGLCLTLLTTGMGFVLSILFIRFDDVKYIVTILLQLVTYLTPVFYPKEMLGSKVRTIVSLNPLTSFLDVFRNVFNGTETATIFDWTYMFGFSLVVFMVGFYLFRKFWVQTVVML